MEQEQSLFRGYISPASQSSFDCGPKYNRKPVHHKVDIPFPELFWSILVVSHDCIDFDGSLTSKLG
eukprot:6458694-Amphidinium_carterae.1